MLIAVAVLYSAETEEKLSQNLKAINAAAIKVYFKGHIPVIGVNTALYVANEIEDLPKREVINNISFAIV